MKVQVLSIEKKKKNETKWKRRQWHRNHQNENEE